MQGFITLKDRVRKRMSLLNRGASVLETKTANIRAELHKRVFINKSCLDSSFSVVLIFEQSIFNFLEVKL